MIACIPDQACHDTVAVQRGSQIIGRDEEILAALIFGKDVARSSRVELKFSGEEVRCLGNNEVIPSDTDNPTFTLHQGKGLLHQFLILTLQMQDPGNRRGLQRVALQAIEDIVGEGALLFSQAVDSALIPFSWGGGCTSSGGGG
jgi:hypothetical protein